MRIASILLITFMAFSNVCLSDEIIILGNSYKTPKIYLENNIPKGILINIAKYIDRQMDKYTFKIELYPWARAYNNALIGKGGIIGLSKTQERLIIFDYSDVVYYDEVVVVVLKGNEFPFDTLDDLRGKTIGIGLKGSYGDDYEIAKQSGLFAVREDIGPVSRLKRLLHKRIDCALISPGKYALYESIKLDRELLNNKENFVILPKPFKRDPNYLGFSKKMNMQSFLKEFNQVLKEHHEDGSIEAIIRNYTTQ